MAGRNLASRNAGNTTLALHQDSENLSSDFDVPGSSSSTLSTYEPFALALALEQLFELYSITEEVDSQVEVNSQVDSEGDDPLDDIDDFTTPQVETISEAEASEAEAHALRARRELAASV